KRPCPQTENKQRDWRGKSGKTHRSQYPADEPGQVQRIYSSIAADTARIRPTARKSGGQPHPGGVLLPQRPVVGKMHIVRQKTFAEQHCESGEQQRDGKKPMEPG